MANTVSLARADRGTRDDRRRELIEGAISVIAQSGLGGTTLAKVAAQAGLSAGIVNHHFQTKEALLTETLRVLSEDFAGAVETAMRASPAAPDGLIAIIALSFDPGISAHEKVAVWYAFQSETHWRKNYTALCGERDKAYMAAIISLMTPLCAEINADADVLARSFAGLLDSYWQDILFEGDGFDRAAASIACARFLASVFPAHASSFATRPSASPKSADIVALKSGKTTTGQAENKTGPAQTLPGWTYNSDEFFALETEKIFLTEWHIVCHVNQLRDKGDYQTFELLNERAFVIRGKDDVIRGFHNVCRHRAHQVVTGQSGNCKGAITCPYHGWNYELTGKLKGVAAPHSFAEFDRQEFGLPALDTEIFMGFVFIRFGGDGAGVAERFAPYAEELKHYRFEEMMPVGELSFQETGADWKNVWDNYLEGYHFNMGHPGLAGLMDSQYDLDARPAQRVSRLGHALRNNDSINTWSGRMYQKIMERPAHLPEHMREAWSYFFFFPLLSFDVYPDVIGHFQVIPTAPGASKLRYQNYALPEQIDSRRGRASRWLNFRINGQVQSEDDHLVTSVQGGLKSSSYHAGILSEKEVLVKNFQDWIRRAVPAARLGTQPVRGTLAARNAELERNAG